MYKGPFYVKIKTLTAIKKVGHRVKKTKTAAWFLRQPQLIIKH